MAASKLTLSTVQCIRILVQILCTPTHGVIAHAVRYTHCSVYSSDTAYSERQRAINAMRCRATSEHGGLSLLSFPFSVQLLFFFFILHQPIFHCYSIVKMKKIRTSTILPTNSNFNEKYVDLIKSNTIFIEDSNAV